jgi:hypothetical protein
MAAAADNEPIPVPAQTPLFHTLEQARYVRQGHIREIEERTERRLIAYVAGPAASVSAIDILPFHDLLQDVAEGDDLDLLLHTPGGDVDQAERIVMMCRKAIGNGAFRVVVPDSAKSAGTLMALAADEIVMGFCSELGPIDPQITIATASGEPMHRPAQSFLDGLKEIVDQTAGGDLSPAYFPLLDKLDPALIDFCDKALKRSEKLASKFLETYMLAGDSDKAKEIAKKLNDSREYLSHGAVIDVDEAEEMGLRVAKLDRTGDLWQAYWRLYCEMRVTVAQSNNPGLRLYEGRKASLSL